VRLHGALRGARNQLLGFAASAIIAFYPLGIVPADLRPNNTPSVTVRAASVDRAAGNCVTWSSWKT
jgi:hypothetical protein